MAELYRRYERRLYRFGVQRLGDNGLADEMVQETFVRLWRTAGNFDAEKASVQTYLYVIARSASADVRKRPSSRPLGARSPAMARSRCGPPPMWDRSGSWRSPRKSPAPAASRARSSSAAPLRTSTITTTTDP
jgi:RNA polymerase sigma factor (sigma-70 family)